MIAEPAEFVARLQRDGKILGGGLFVRDDLVLTCAHLTKEDEGVLVDLPRRRSRVIAAHVIDWIAQGTAAGSGAVRDLCLLQLDEPLEDFTPPALAASATLTGHAFRTIGFPADYDMGITASGAIRERLPGGWWQLDATEEPGHAVAEGFSGTPVFDATLNAFVGLVAEYDTAPTKTGTMVPLEVFANAFAEAAQAMAEGLLQRWRRWEAARHAELELRAALSAPSLHVTPAPSALWNEFTRRVPWHEQMRRELEAFVASANAIDRLPQRVRSVAEAFDRIDCDASYPELLQQIRKAIPATLLGDVQALARSEGDVRRDVYGRVIIDRRTTNIRDLQRCAFRLAKHVDRPRFARCMLLAGRFGSGKTHFCASLLDRGMSSHELHLPVELTSSVDIATQILDRVRDASSIAWESLADFDAVVTLLDEKCGFGLQVNILMDDIDLPIRRNPQVLTALTQFIDAHTALHSLRYLLTIQDAQYDRVAVQTEFWLRQTAFGPPGEYEWESGTPTSAAGGWIFLDDLNEQTQTGQSILRQARDWTMFPQEAERTLAHPLTATILVDLGDDAEDAASLNFPEFVEHFWRRRKATLDPAPLNESQLDEAIALVAQLTSDLGESPAVRSLLARAGDRSRELFGTSWSGEQMQAALAVLETASLLRTQLQQANDPTSRRLLLLVEAFWCHQLAIVVLRHVREQTVPKHVSRAVREWFQRRSLAGLAEGTLELLLLLIARDDPKATRTAAIARAAFAGDGLSTAAPWLAGARMDVVHQQRFLDGGLQHIGPASSLRTTFAFLYFLRGLTTPPAQRLASSTRVFEAIGKHSLGSYFIYFFDRTLDDFESAPELAAALVAMNGVEATDVAPILGDLAADRLVRLAGPHQVLDVLLEHYLRPASANAIKREGPWKRLYFREWLVHFILGNLATRLHIGLYPMLAERRWYEGSRIGMRYPVPIEMEREANIAIGSRYRRFLDLKEREQFVDKLLSMIEDGNARDRNNAFFIIRHTEPPSKSEYVVVRPEFRPLLAKLAEDAQFVAKVWRFADVFAANVPEFQRPPRPPSRPRPSSA